MLGSLFFLYAAPAFLAHKKPTALNEFGRLASGQLSALLLRDHFAVATTTLFHLLLIRSIYQIYDGVLVDILVHLPSFLASRGVAPAQWGNQLFS
jgi:hypothetical protein